jgi:hypothetical protein
MKRIAITATVLVAAALGSIGPSNAAGVVVGAGPHGVYVGTTHRHHWRHDYDYARCRTIVTTRWRHGERITVRRRVCD